MTRDAAEATGLDPGDIAAPLHRSHLTQNALNWAEPDRLMNQAGHTNPRTAAGYAEDTKQIETNGSRGLYQLPRMIMHLRH